MFFRSACMQKWPFILALGMLGSLGLSSVAFAEAKNGAPSPIEEQVVQSISCKNGNDLRQLEVHTQNAGCVLNYTKYGKTSQVAVARNGVELCQAKLKNVKTRLDEGGYRCE